MTSFSDAPQIRIGELSRRVGVSIDRLRAWERRYGLLRPTRTAGGFRLYTPADERRLRAMQQQLAAGLSAAEAARTVLAADPLATTDRSPADQRRALTQALDAFEAARAHAELDRVFADLGVDEALRTVIFPFLSELGERWARGDIRIGDEHFASSLLHARLLAQLRGRTDGTGPMALLACAPAELHTLGLIGFAIALRNRGWRITYLGADTPVAEVRSVAATISPAITVLSAVMPSRFDDVTHELRDLATHVRLALAGAGANATLAKHTGAHRLEGDPVTVAASISHIEPHWAE